MYVYCSYIYIYIYIVYIYHRGIAYIIYEPWSSKEGLKQVPDMQETP